MESQSQSLMDERETTRVTLPDEEEDRISRLPDEILASIVSRFTLGEAVRTSVLSKRWRYVWAHSIRALNFDAKEMQLKHLLSSGDDYSGDGEWGSPDSYNYSKWVSGVLAQYRGPNVDEFRVCYDLNWRYSSLIDDWVQFALSNRLHKLELTLASNYAWQTPHTRWNWDTLHPRLRMGSNVFVGFKSLKILSLTSVDVGDEDVQYLLSECPLLERLTLLRNHVLRILKVVGPSPLFRHLDVVGCDGIEGIEICDTNLVSFTLVCRSRCPEVLVKNSPQLVDVILNSFGAIRYMLAKFSCIYSQLQSLQLTVHHCQGDGYWGYNMPVLENLKQFGLILEMVVTDPLLGYLTMIEDWPNLQRFVLHINLRRGGGIGRRPVHIKPKETEEYVTLREETTFCHPGLKVFELAGYCHPCHFDIIQQIIRNAVALEKIIIRTRPPPNRQSGVLILRELQSGEEQQLRGLVPPRVELVIL